MGYGSRKIKILALLSAILFSWYWCSTTLFYHSHLIDGEQIFHSHPYTGTPSSHGHTAGALQTISYLSLLTVVLASLATVPMAAFSGLKLFVALSTSKSQAPTLQAYSLRAPPIG